MSGSPNDLDPKLLQAKWVLGGIEPEEFVKIAISALQQGIDGTALQQLAGLTQPTARDLGVLPARIFTDMGLQPIDKHEAVSILRSRGEPSTSPVICALVKAFPAFSVRWEKHIEQWKGNPAGSYNDIAEFVMFVVEDLYEKGHVEETRRVFEFMEQLHADGDEDAKTLIQIGFFEGLQNCSSWRPGGKKVYEKFFGPTSMQIWRKLQEIWAGRSSLMDVIRAEQKNNRESSE